ncbi:WAS/WASL-interacting protein family member 2-like [Eschrichtius robustus]|uniref:WAS/WASL-interacting protein family member 2-like n=1 Tax=Eschrichtius robustus TaxID=9764 RepID=UPI0035C1C874
MPVISTPQTQAGARGTSPRGSSLLGTPGTCTHAPSPFPKPAKGDRYPSLHPDHRPPPSRADPRHLFQRRCGWDWEPLTLPLPSPLHGARQVDSEPLRLSRAARAPRRPGVPCVPRLLPARGSPARRPPPAPPPAGASAAAPAPAARDPARGSAPPRPAQVIPGRGRVAPSVTASGAILGAPGWGRWLGGASPQCPRANAGLGPS